MGLEDDTRIRLQNIRDYGQLDNDMRQLAKDLARLRFEGKYDLVDEMDLIVGDIIDKIKTGALQRVYQRNYFADSDRFLQDIFLDWMLSRRSLNEWCRLKNENKIP